MGSFQERPKSRLAIPRITTDRMSRFLAPTIAGNLTQITLCRHKAYLEQTVFFLNAISLTICLVGFLGIPMLRVQLYTATKLECLEGPGDDCLRLNLTVEWLAYSFHSGMETLVPLLGSALAYAKDNGTVDKSVDESIGEINEKWMDYQVAWPLDLACCIGVILLDFIRRARRMDYHMHDAAPMFSMSLLQFTVACLRAVETFFYYNLLTGISVVLSRVNKAVKRRAIEEKQHIPLTFCLEPPKIHFAVSMLGVFMSVLDVTLILDYMDPV